MYKNHFGFDELEATGHKIRAKNKMKAKNLMQLSVNFVDPDSLGKVQHLLLSLPPEKLKLFKNFLNDRDYLNSSSHQSPEYKILRKIANIALLSVPKDPYLKKLLSEYTKNLKEIDDLKIQSTQTIHADKLTEIMAKIDEHNEENIIIFERVDEYRKKKYETI